ncbi:MAG: hypothetical protein M3Q97_10180, partial [Bacteroidota bacterium]|nr:hypothetical protein [Bacteroidota bacterium]
MVQTLENGIYLQKNVWHGDYLLVTLIPVQHTYKLENQYLDNDFVLGSPGKALFNVSFGEKGNGYAIHSRKALLPLFTLEPAGWDGYFGGVAWLFGIGILLLLWSGRLIVIRYWREIKYFEAMVWLCSLLALTVLAWRSHSLPAAMFQSQLFSPMHYASSSMLASLGDLLSLTLLLCWFIWTVGSLVTPWSSQRTAILWVTGSFLFGSTLVHIAEGLVLDSNISFDLSNIYGIEGFSLLGLALLFTWLGCFLYMGGKAARLLRSLDMQRAFIILSVSVVAAAGMLYLQGMLYPEGFIHTAVVLLIFYRKTSRKGITVLRRPLAYALLSCMVITFLLSHYTVVKSLESQRRVASRLTTERDAVAEYLFTGLMETIQKDMYAQAYFVNPMLAHPLLEKRVQEVYFTGYFDKYDVRLFTFTNEGLPYKMASPSILESFLRDSSKEITPVSSNSLYFEDNYSGLPAYLGLVPIYAQGRLLGSMLLRFQLKTVYEESAYPELLLSDNVQNLRENEGFSYAIYNGQRLATQRGIFTYPDAVTFSVPEGVDYGTFQENGFYHLVHRVNPEVTVVVSSRKPSMLSHIAAYAFLVFLASVFTGLVYLLWQAIHWARRVVAGKVIFPNRLRFSFGALPFRTKILAAIVAGMTLSLLLIGFITIRYIIYVYNADVTDKLRNRTRLVSSLMEEELRSLSGLPFSTEQVRAKVKELSVQYQADINVFNINGFLQVSTQPGIYEQGILSPRMSPRAYTEFRTSFPSILIKEERVGKLRYTASYMPLRSYTGQMVGFINLPFFTKEKELNERLSSFVVALVNLYILLFFILVLIGIFISRALTAPLDIIRRH